MYFLTIYLYLIFLNRRIIIDTIQSGRGMQQESHLHQHQPQQESAPQQESIPQKQQHQGPVQQQQFQQNLYHQLANSDFLYIKSYRA